MTNYKGYKITLLYQPYGVESSWVMVIGKSDFDLGRYRIDEQKTLIEIELEAKEKIDNYLKNLKKEQLKL